MSSSLSTYVKFTTPSTLPGVFDVTILPKSCEDPCQSQVQFAFEQFDAALPELVAPIPTSAAVQRTFLPPILLRNAPRDLAIAWRVVFTDAVGKSYNTNISRVVDVPMSQYAAENVTRIRAITIVTPEGIAAG